MPESPEPMLPPRAIDLPKLHPTKRISRDIDRTPSQSPRAPEKDPLLLYDELPSEFPVPPHPPKRKTRKKKHHQVKSFDLGLPTPDRAVVWSREDKNCIERPSRKRYANIDLNFVHKRFKLPIPELAVKTSNKVFPKDLRPGDLIFIYDYRERGDTKTNSRKPETLGIPPPLKPLHKYINPDYFKGRDRDPREGESLDKYLDEEKDQPCVPRMTQEEPPASPSLDALARNRNVSSSNQPDSENLHPIPVKSKHVMIVTTHPSSSRIAKVAHVTEFRARITSIRASVGETEAQMLRRISFMSMGFSQRSFDLTYQAVVYRLAQNPKLGHTIADVASKLIARGVCVPRVVDVDRITIHHNGGFLKKSCDSMFRRPAREDFDCTSDFLNVYSSEFAMLAIQRALYKEFKEGQKFEEIVSILDQDPTNPWPTITQSYVETNKHWRKLGHLDLEFVSE